ncbi:hypothetical protein [Acinetobacter nosocomialis]|uniref:hypothetical protein n=1 Tax=Acinetobacter nosocomialis TaxID=106654 RepID=UPI00237EB54C|nr:hypothetical protein [Acinetobacter nosocomialis]MDE1703595.1 hypothetical protein [Acinetobacter nosocomialis]HDG7210055.1 hypothetical protein [Acinetobacter nosocomialis]
MINDSEYTFSLYVSGLKLSEINPLESAKLLEALCKILGAKHLEWGEIKEGSADYAVKCKAEYIEEKLESVSKSISQDTRAIGIITEFLNKHPKASTLLRYKNSANDEYMELHKFQRKEESFEFVQQESIRGRIVGLLEGRDKTDHISVNTISGKNVKVTISPELSANLGVKWRTEHQLEISGKAKYKYRNYKDVELIQFIAESINEIQEGNILDWIDNFKKAGDSGWNDFDDPIEAWLKERHE